MTPAIQPMKSYVVTQRRLNTTFYLTAEGLPTDIPARAATHFQADAQEIAEEANRDPDWKGMQHWTVQRAMEVRQ